MLSASICVLAKKCSVCLTFHYFCNKILHKCEKNIEIGDFNLSLDCAAPKCWSKYTTGKLFKFLNKKRGLSSWIIFNVIDQLYNPQENDKFFAFRWRCIKNGFSQFNHPSLNRSFVKQFLSLIFNWYIWAIYYFWPMFCCSNFAFVTFESKALLLKI